MSFISVWIVTIISVIIMIPFLTLVERKVLSYIQLRKGPNKVGVLGVLQPISDGVKLVFKESGPTIRVNSFLFWITPLLNFVLMLILFIIFSPLFPSYSINLGLLGYLCISSLLVYSILFSGWSSNSKYSFLGSLRGAAQVISYEISMLTLIFFPSAISSTFNINFINIGFHYSILVFVFVFILWLITIVAETNRSPFDFAEGESEIVSGFNTEYSSFIFALLFLGEYGNIIFISFLTSFIFFPNFPVLYFIIPIFIIFLFLVFRGTFPRFRYDLLMNLAWKVILPCSLIFFWILFLF
uniref:NADH-ubiquinone oxidoreductase chain 1 n=1 Tax=Bothromesostoma personatum TaxID=27905 RepID=A0A343VVI7_9PLAT